MIDKNDTTPSPNGDNGGRDARRYDRNSDASARLDDLVRRQVNPKGWAQTTGVTLLRMAQQYDEAYAVSAGYLVCGLLSSSHRMSYLKVLLVQEVANVNIVGSSAPPPIGAGKKSRRIWVAETSRTDKVKPVDGLGTHIGQVPNQGDQHVPRRRDR